MLIITQDYWVNYYTKYVMILSTFLHILCDDCANMMRNSRCLLKILHKWPRILHKDAATIFVKYQLCPPSHSLSLWALTLLYCPREIQLSMCSVIIWYYCYFSTLLQYCTILQYYYIITSIHCECELANEILTDFGEIVRHWSHRV